MVDKNKTTYTAVKKQQVKTITGGAKYSKNYQYLYDDSLLMQTCWLILFWFTKNFQLKYAHEIMTS